MSTWRVTFYKGTRSMGTRYVRATSHDEAINTGLTEWKELTNFRTPTRITANKL